MSSPNALSLRLYTSNNTCRACWARITRQHGLGRLLSTSAIARATANASTGSIRPRQSAIHCSIEDRLPRYCRTRNPTPTRSYHASPQRHQEALDTPAMSPDLPSPPVEQFVPIRQRLQRWQDEHGKPNEEVLSVFGDYPTGEDAVVNAQHSKSSTSTNESLESEEVTEEDIGEAEDINTTDLTLYPGDVVELVTAKREPVLALYIRKLERRHQFYLMTGKWIHADMRDAMFLLPGLINRSTYEAILPYLPTTENVDEITGKQQPIDPSVPREIGAPVLKQLLGLWRQSEAIYREHASVLDNAFSELAHTEKSIMMTLKEITRKLLGDKILNVSDPSPAVCLAVRKALQQDSFRITSDRRHQRTTSIFTIRSWKEVRATELAQSWIRDYQEYLVLLANGDGQSSPAITSEQHSKGAHYVSQFVEKSRKLIAYSRKLREPTLYGNVGPSKNRYPLDSETGAIRSMHSLAFTDSDRLLITFMESWVLIGRFQSSFNLSSMGPALLIATECYKAHEPDRGCGMLFLQEIGVLAPYENRVAYDEFLALPTSGVSRGVELIASKASNSAERDMDNLEDHMRHLRHDWGSMNVYCIDDIGAQEIDDGVSISKVDVAPGKEPEWWVHVHIANPTAFIERNSILAQLAESMTESVYLQERTHPMLPRRASSKFSLRPQQPCLTFSARLDRWGNVLEKKIQSGFIRIVVKLTPDRLSNLVDGVKQEARPRLVVGGQVPEANTDPLDLGTSLPPNQMSELSDLNMLAKALFEKRLSRGGLHAQRTESAIKVYQKQGLYGLGWNRPNHSHARFTDGDPVIELIGEPHQNWFKRSSSKSKLVQEMMLLTAYIGSAWCAERGIPIIYRGTVPSASPAEMQRFREEILTPSMDADGAPPLPVGMKYLELYGRSAPSTVAKPHKFVGTDSFSKLTSPLRRYGDMVAHWQIEAALKQEALTGKKFDAAKDLQKLPFSAQELESFMKINLARESLITRTKLFSLAFWTSHLLLRAHYFKETPLPETWNLYVFDYDRQYKRIRAVEMGHSIPALMALPESQGLCTARPGDVWETKILEVNVFKRALSFVPIRLISRESYTLT